MASLSAMTIWEYARMKARHPDIAIDTDNGSIVLARVCTRCEGEGLMPGWVTTSDCCLTCDGQGYLATDAGLAILRLMELRK